MRLEAAAERAVIAAIAAPTMAGTVKELRSARDASAAARLAEATATLGRRERVRLETLALAPFGSVLASMGLHDASAPFPKTLAAERRARGALGSESDLAETAGVPVLRDARAAPAVAQAALRGPPLLPFSTEPSDT